MTTFITVFLGTFIGIIITLLLITVIEGIIFEEGKAVQRSGRLVILVISLILGFISAYNLIN